MLQRTSSVNHLHVTTLAFSSIVQLGDSSIINGYSRALAVQREKELFFGNEGNLSKYPVFNREIPLLPIDEPISIATTNKNPIIKVNNINVIGVSSSSIIHVGNSKNVYMETRIKHIRQLLNSNGRDNLNEANVM
ncbi:spore germination protein GerPE [Cytobacillus sp. FJAT-54145]|uniref:Spore germination protein GerPE n=1 Tax=Cytobacillus spartinae TaxID=3299023 RepID=A0ABW6KC66_9BACI